VECLEEGILWDADYDDELLFIDETPEKAKELKRLLGISEDYFRAVPDDLSKEEMEAKLVELRKLCRSIVEGS